MSWTILLFKRLTGSWQLLFKYAVKHYDIVRQQFESQSKPRRSLCVQFQQTTDVMLAVVCRLQRLNVDCPFRTSPRLVPGSHGQFHFVFRTFAMTCCISFDSEYCFHWNLTIIYHICDLPTGLDNDFIH